jgi:hypothetical protein
MIHFSCSCGKTLMAQEQFIGEMIQCPKCGQQMEVPRESDPASIPEPAPPPPMPPYRSPPPHEPEPLPSSPPPFSSSPGEQSGTGYPSQGTSYPAQGSYPASGASSPPPAGTPGVNTSAMAVASFILGLVSFCLPIVLSVPAIILGIAGWVRIAQGKQKGVAFAITGLILGLVTGVTCGIFSYLIYPDARSLVASNENLKKIGPAMLRYHDNHKAFPSHAIYGDDGKPLLSWRVAILPELGYEDLYREFKLNEPWDSAHNKALLEKMPSVYAHPTSDDAMNKGYTYYQVFVSEPEDARVSMFPRSDKGMTSADIKDGLSTTLMVVEAATPVPWTKPEDITFSTALPIAAKVGGPYKFMKGFQCCYADGKEDIYQMMEIPEDALRNTITANGGEVGVLPRH